jgi:CheY-like chemotaxis protein
MKILYVEDDEGSHQLMILVIEKTISGADITVATSGEEALEKLQETQFDLILTDNCMPGMTGVELTRRARATGIQSMIVVHSSDDFEEETLEAGADDFLHKSLGAVDIVKKLSVLLEDRAGNADPGP